MELIIVTYHYIEDPKKYKAGIHPIHEEKFREHLEHLSKTYSFITEGDLVSGVRGEKKIPDKACLVTFDDGLKSQRERAVPILIEKAVPAIFFVTTRPYTEHKASAVHKVHYLLSQIDAKILFNESIKFLQKTEYPTNLFNEKLARAGKWYIYDDLITAQFKYLANHGLPQSVSDNMISELFSLHYPEGEKHFCDVLYMSVGDIKEISQNSLFSIGLHTHTHLNIKESSKETVYKDITANYKHLSENIGISSIQGISYPYGMISSEEYEDKVVYVAHELGLSYGVTTVKGINETLNHPFFLKRMNPNDFFKAS